MRGRATLTLHQETDVDMGPFLRRLVRLEHNPFIMPLPPPSKDPVGDDLRLIPQVSG